MFFLNCHINVGHFFGIPNYTRLTCSFKIFYLLPLQRLSLLNDLLLLIFFIYLLMETSVFSLLPENLASYYNFRAQLC